MTINSNKVADRIVAMERRKERLTRKFSSVDTGWDYAREHDKSATTLVCKSCGSNIDISSEKRECDHCAIVSDYKRANIEARLNAIGITKPTTDKKIMNKLNKFLSKEPISTKRFVLFLGIFALISLFIDFFSIDIHENAFYGLLLMLTWLFVLLSVLVDVIRTKNKTKRLKDV